MSLWLALWASLLWVVQAFAVLVSWQAPTTNADGSPLTDLASYTLYYGTVSRSYSVRLPAITATQAIIEGLTPGQTYYFAVSATDQSGNESVLSAEVPYTVQVPPGDTIPPTLIQSSPQAGETNVDPSGILTGTFSEAMNSSSINATTVELRDAKGKLFPSAIAYSASTFTLGLAPSHRLAFGMAYTWTMIGLSDQAGNILASVLIPFITAPNPHGS